MERRRKTGERIMPQWFDPMNTPEGDMLAHARELKARFTKADDKSQYICDGCGKTDPSGVEPSGKCVECRMDMKTDKKVMEGEGHYDKKKSGDTTSDILAEHGIIVKYSQETSVDDQVPQFMSLSGGKPAVRSQGYGTNGVIPAMNEAPSKKIISEVYKMPAVSQTGYDKNASSLHMHLNDGGVNKNNPNRAPIEESLASIKKSSGEGQMGVVSDITDLLEKIYPHL